MTRRGSFFHMPKRRFWRVLWLVVLLGHTPATIQAVSAVFSSTGSDSWSSLVLLSAAHLFFLLEIAFAPSLQVLTNKRAAVAFLLIVALLHVGVIEHGLPDVLAGQNPKLWLVVVAAGAVFRRELLGILSRVAAVLLASLRTLIDRHRPTPRALQFCLPHITSLDPLRRAPQVADRAPPSRFASAFHVWAAPASVHASSPGQRRAG